MQKSPSLRIVEDYYAAWPTPYRADSDACTAPEPRWRRGKILKVAPYVVNWLLNDDQKFAISYSDLVRVYHDASDEYDAADLSPRYIRLLSKQEVLIPNDFEVANEHDMANLHRAVWLLMIHALARLQNYNVHGDWGDPPGGGTSQGRYDDPPPPSDLLTFHTTPNSYGSYAIGTSDIPAPDLGIGEAPYPPKAHQGAVPAPSAGSLSREAIVKIARLLGRRLADRATLDAVGQSPYHRIVKRYYLDRANHTSEYAAVIGDLVIPGDAKAAAELAAAIGDDEFAEIHRGAWLFLAHRFSYHVGKNPFGDYGDVPQGERRRSVDLPKAVDCPRVFEIPNADGEFTLNLVDVDPEKVEDDS